MKRRLILLTMLIFLAASNIRSAHADAAPPENADGSGIEGEYPTKVQMISEDVLMTLKDDMTAEVVATFDLRNMGTEPEAFDVRFPIGQPDGYLQVSRLTRFAAWVDGELAPVREEWQSCLCTEDIDIPWMHWPVEFPPGQIVKVAVGYQINGDTAYVGDAYSRYNYVLHTGAGWDGLIGAGTIRFRLPYEVNDFNALMGWPAPTPAWYTAEGTDIVWRFTDLEPTEADNVSISVLRPTVWRAIQAAVAAAQENPASLDAQLYLARSWYDALPIERHGFLSETGRHHDIAYETDAAYTAALSLVPNSVPLHVEYVEFLYAVSQYPSYGFELPLKLRPALDAALALDSTHARLLEIQADLNINEDMFLTAIPTRTPAAPATLPPSTPPAIAQTESAELTIPATRLTDVPSNTPSASASTPAASEAPSAGCFGASALLMTLTVLVWIRRRT